MNVCWDGSHGWMYKEGMDGKGVRGDEEMEVSWDG